MSSPWGKPAPVAVVPSLRDVMSEELAGQFQEEEYIGAEGAGCAAAPCQSAAESVPAAATNTELHPQDTSDDFLLAQQLQNEELPNTVTKPPTDTDDDLLMAQMLQAEFDKEHDQQIRREENKFNGTNKVSISFQNYRRTRDDEVQAEGSDSEDEDYDDDNFAPEPDPKPAGSKVTKHDATVCSRRNASKAMDQFPLELRVGDSSDFDMKLSNKVYNKLKQHSHAEEKRSNRLHEKKEHSTADMAVDERTRLILFKLVNADVLSGVHGIVSTGKEAAVIHAQGGSAPIDGMEVPEEVALKVFKTTLTDFKNRADYVKGDVRYFKDEFKKQNPRKIMRLWAEKEQINLKKLHRHGIPCPRALALRKHVLLMTFLGRDRRPAPKLKEARLRPVDAELAWDQVKEILRRMYVDCQLVHADFSEYNLLWHQEQVFVIDVSQAVDVMHPHAHEFLLRDCRNATQFFKKCGVAEVVTEYELFNSITGMGLTGTGNEFLMQVQEYEKNEEKLRTGKGRDFAFDFFFDLSKNESKKDSDDSSESEEGEVDPS